MSQVSAAPIAADTHCTNCGYNLRGLNPGDQCPECSLNIAQSLKGDYLRYSSREYLAKLHNGIFLVQAGIIAGLMLGILAFGVGVAAAAGGFGGATFVYILGVVGVLSTAAIFIGWWLFSSPDPAYQGREDPAAARSVVRFAILFQLACSLVSFIVPLIDPALAGPGTTFNIAMQIAGSVGWVVQFFAAMQYLRWLTRRIPDDRAFKRATTFRWLGPVLWTVGLLALGLGPLIALIMYWNLLDWIRKDLKGIRANAAFAV